MTNAQKYTLEGVLRNLRVSGGENFGHGDCFGADFEVHTVALKLGYKITIHPASNTNKRAYSPGAIQTLPAKPALERNRDIVIASDFMIFCPKGVREEHRSGTWMTYRITRKIEKPRILIYPDGTYYSLTDIGRGWTEEVTLG